MSEQVITTLIIGVPSVLFAAASYVLAARARHEAEDLGKKKVDADAYNRAKGLYESSISELRKGQADLRAEVTHLNEELAQARHELAEARSRIWELEHPHHPEQ